MKRPFLIYCIIVLLLGPASLNKISGQSISSDNIITKGNGKIILAYKSFEEFLKSNKSWANYKKIVLGSCSEMQAVHNKSLSWGSIDSVRFPEEVTKFKKADWEKYFSQYNRKMLDYLYDSLIARANKTLAPLNHNAVDLCLFLPYSGCFIIPGEEKCTIYISLLINPDEVPKIMIHEYAHNLHIQRRPVEPFNLKRELVSEGMAVYLTTLILKDPGLSRSIPFMPESSVKWCFENEQLIRESIKPELNDTTYNCLKKFIADGPVSTPPKGFVEKTGYFAGYQIIESCIKKGMKLEDICLLNSDTVIAESGYFN